ncbi:MAG: serine hydrolase domain-containing protein [Pseudomonadota bacterium]
MKSGNGRSSLMHVRNVSHRLAMVLAAVVVGVVPYHAVASLAPQSLEPIEAPQQESELYTDSSALGSPNGSSSLPINRRELERFVDGIVKTTMHDHRIAGVVVSVVSKDEELLLKGYGVADADEGRQTDPINDLFRVASISKTFTATAIMQLKEQQRVDLSADVRNYLGDLPFDDAKGAISIADLLTHTAGFEDRATGYFGANPVLSQLSRTEQFAALAPKQVRAPGELASYSNFGFAMLGEVIAQVSGLTYAEYIDENIFRPLGMASSTSSIRSTPVGEGDERLEQLREREAKSHRRSGGQYVTQSFAPTLDLIEPEGSVSTTAADMSKFMRAHLTDGALDDARILSSDTIREMHQTLHSHLPGTNGNAHGFWVDETTGRRILKHGGSINDFKSQLVLYPDVGIGVFISTNSAGGSALSRLPDRIASAFFPPTTKPPSLTDPVFFFDAADVVGKYLGARRVHSRIGKMFSIPNVLSAKAISDSVILVTGDFGSTRYEKMDDGVFREPSSLEPLGATFDVSGKASRLFFGGSPANPYEAVSFANAPITLFLPLALAGLLSLSVMGGYAIRGLGFRYSGSSSASRVERVLVFITSLVTLIFIALLLRWLVMLSTDFNILYEPFPTPGVRLLVSGGYMVIASSFVVSVLAARSLIGSERTILTKTRLLVFASSICLLAWSLLHWKLFSI